MVIPFAASLLMTSLIIVFTRQDELGKDENMDHQQLRELLAKKSLERQKKRDDLPADAQNAQNLQTQQQQQSVEGQLPQLHMPGRCRRTRFRWKQTYGHLKLNEAELKLVCRMSSRTVC